MKKSIINLVAIAMACFTTVSFAGDNACYETNREKAKVYFTRDISPKGILKVYNAINAESPAVCF